MIKAYITLFKYSFFQNKNTCWRFRFDIFRIRLYKCCIVKLLPLIYTVMCWFFICIFNKLVHVFLNLVRCFSIFTTSFAAVKIYQSFNIFITFTQFANKSVFLLCALCNYEFSDCIDIRHFPIILRKFNSILF